jgi:hypothetical protein
MTERLSSLLHDEADTVDIPAPRAAEVLTQGHRIRRRQRLTSGAATIAVLGVVAGGVATVQSLGDSPDTGRDVTSAQDPAQGAVFAVGTTVYLDGAKEKGTVDDRAIKSLYYTSAGVLVRHGNNPYSDGGGPMRFSLVRDDGTVQPLDVTYEETVPSTDPTQPYLAYAEVTDGNIEVVVLDVTDGQEAARVPVPGDFAWGGWRAPPVALDGDQVYIGTDNVLQVVDWRTGEVSENTNLPAGFPDIRGGHAVQENGDVLTVVDARSGDTLLTVPTNGFGYLVLSPDGRYAAVEDQSGGDSAVDVYDVTTGSHVSIKDTVAGYGWAPDDSLFQVSGDTLTTCDPASGHCATGRLDLDTSPGDNPAFTDDLKLGGVTYES